MPHKLLLADDSITIQRVIELTFADEDVNVSAVGDGQQAIERIEADPPDIVLADVGMPKRDGYDVAAYVKSRPTLAHIPVVLLTGAFEPVDQARATAVGCDDVLAKPFEPQMVINRVKQLLGNKSASAAGQRAATIAPPTSDRETATPGPPPVADRGGLALDTKGPGADGGSRDAVLEEYFDQLDAAFSTTGEMQTEGERSNWAPASPQSDREMVVTDWAPAGTSQATSADATLEPATGLKQAGVGEFEWVPPPAAAESAHTAGISDARVEPRAGDAEVYAGAEVTTAAPSQPNAREDRQQTAPPASIADAFAALLAAEQGEAPMPIALGPSTAPLLVTEELVDQIATRVLTRLSDKVVRDTVTEVVSQIAERLVREEIERIKKGL